MIKIPILLVNFDKTAISPDNSMTSFHQAGFRL